MRRTLSALLLLLATGAAPGASAEFYFGAKTGPMMVDAPGADDPTNIGVTLGYELGLLVADLGVEAEFTRGTGSGNTEVDSNALYLAFRSGGPIYLILRGGAIDEEVRIGGAKTSETGSSFGAGVGFSVGLLRVEAELTRIEKDVNFLSLGVQF